MNRVNDDTMTRVPDDSVDQSPDRRMTRSSDDSIAHSKEGRLAVIAGNGHFPFLVLDAARDQGFDPVVVAIKEEASQELGRAANTIHWLSLGEVMKLLELLGR